MTRRRDLEPVPRGLLQSMGIDPAEFYADQRRFDSGLPWEQAFDEAPTEPAPPGTMWVPKALIESLIVEIRRWDTPVNTHLATMDLEVHRAKLSLAQMVVRWGWTRHRVRTFVKAFDGGKPYPKAERFGVVYAISTEAPDAPVKIGFTTGTGEERLSALQTGSPVRLVLLGEVPALAHVERKLHRELKAHRLHGEWFAREPALAALERLRSAP